MQKVKANFKLKSKKKGGFTLIEVVAVIAIICILAVALLPKFNGYITQAKKVAVVDQCRKVVMAVESYDMKNDKPLEDSTTDVKGIKEKAGEYFDKDNLDKLPDDTTLTECKDIVNGGSFDIDSNGKYSLNTAKAKVKNEAPVS